MASSPDYAKGWYAGIRGRWPEHKPPIPPEKVLAQLMNSATNMRNEADTLCAVFDENDKSLDKLRNAIDNFDAAMTALTRWLKQ